MTNELQYQIALTLIPKIGDVHAKALVNRFGNATSIFTANKKELENMEGIGSIRADSIKKFNNFQRCEDEIKFIEKYKITPLFLTDKNYPQRLLHCYDSPTLLYYRGNADLNHSKIISIVGTRNYSEYGKLITEKLIAELEQENILIVSGLAFGIDTIAHKAALKNNLLTLGVLAHGLDRIYPIQNKTLAKQLITKGGLLTEFMSDTIPDKQNFPKRNRIVAGMGDAILVIESGIKGGSLITAELANSYNKDVFAIPGKLTDGKSEGCNHLIKTNRASLLTSATDLLEIMNWSDTKKITPKKQPELFIELTDNEKIIFALLQQQESIQIDQLHFKSGLSTGLVAEALLSLEMQGIILSIPGKVFKLA
jgi:DNA processing protein